MKASNRKRVEGGDMATFIVNHEKLRAFIKSLMMKEGMCEEDAFTCADNLVDADLCGVESHGVSRTTNYMKRLRTGVVRHKDELKVISEFPAAISIDGANEMGMVVGKFAMEKCIEKARETGCCFATANHSNHYGMASYYARMAANEGMIGVTSTNAPPNIAPWGSSKKYMGTNPIAISAPTSGEPIILDMAPSVVAMGKIILAAKLGKKIPEGWVLDPDGNPTTDPVVGQYGTLLPIGGAKGSGIAIFGEILCGVLAGAACGPYINHFWKDFEHPQNVGQYFMAIDISKFLPLDEFIKNMDSLVSELKALPKNPGVEEIFMPGEIEAMRRRERMKNGIELSEQVYGELEDLGQQYDVSFYILEEGEER